MGAALMLKKFCIAVIGLVVLFAVTDAFRSPFAQVVGRAAETEEQTSQPTRDIPVKGMVTMIDLGAKACIPCKMMAPVMEKVEKDYRGRAAIIFIDVGKDKEPTQRFGIRAIPTQIFFDKQGKEVYRHLGFLSEEAIVSQLQKMGVN
jgi:thioredoxin 1